MKTPSRLLPPPQFPPRRRRVDRRRPARLAYRIRTALGALALAIVVLDQIGAIPEASATWRNAFRLMAAAIVSLGFVSRANGAAWFSWRRRRRP